MLLLIYLFIWSVYYVLGMLPWLDKSNWKMQRLQTCSFTSLSFMLSDSCFYRRECSRRCLKVAIGINVFGSLKEITFAYRHLYFVVVLRTCIWSRACLCICMFFFGWFIHKTMVCNINSCGLFCCYGLCKPKYCNILDLLFDLKCLYDAWTK